MYVPTSLHSLYADSTHRLPWAQTPVRARAHSGVPAQHLPTRPLHATRRRAMVHRRRVESCALPQLRRIAQ